MQHKYHPYLYNTYVLIYMQVEYIEREIRPQDVRERSGGFSSSLRARLFAQLGAGPDDEAGHLVANTVFSGSIFSKG